MHWLQSAAPWQVFLFSPFYAWGRCCGLLFCCTQKPWNPKTLLLGVLYLLETRTMTNTDKRCKTLQTLVPTAEWVGLFCHTIRPSSKESLKTDVSVDANSQLQKDWGFFSNLKWWELCCFVPPQSSAVYLLSCAEHWGEEVHLLTDSKDSWWDERKSQLTDCWARDRGIERERGRNVRKFKF